jgi:hypothetical protein
MSQLPQQQWEIMPQYLSYFNWLNSELYRANMLDFLSGTEVLSSLYLQASADTTNPNSAHYLVAAKNLYWNAVSAIEGAYGSNSKKLTPWLYRVVLSHYYQSTLVKRRGLTSYNYKTDEPTIVNGWSLSKKESLQKSYNIGAELLKRIRDIESAEGNQEAEAIAWLYLADWEATFDNRSTALEYYQKANRLFLGSGAQQQTIDRLFAQTSVLPESGYRLALADLITQAGGSSSTTTFVAWSENFPATPAPAALDQYAAASRNTIHAQVSFDYNLGSSPELNNGRKIDQSLFAKNNIRLISISTEFDGAEAQALRDVSLLHFRPQLRSGELVSSEGITVDYVFSRQGTPLLLSDTENWEDTP